MKDIFNEDGVTPIKGLIRRYKTRVLLELTLKCPVECDFCYRKWKKEQCRESLEKIDIDNIVKYLLENKEINEIIFSGGEPLIMIDLLEYIFEKVSQLEQVKIFRIHTRAPVTAPDLVSKRFLDILEKKYKQIIYLSIHINHIDELNLETESAITKIRQTGVILYSQSVLLKGVNNSVEALASLFKRLVEIGVRPYNIYQCNKIEGLEKYMVSIIESIKIMTELRKSISGFCCPNLIIDVPGNANKIPVPLLFWDVKMDSFRDFEGNLIKISEV